MGWTLSAFGWAYALFEIPGGWLGDKHRPAPRADADRHLVVVLHGGDRLGLERASSLVVTRALFGAGEAGAFPNLTRVLTTWLPVKERERAQAVVWLATRLSGAFTPLLVALLIRRNRVAPDVRGLRRHRGDLGDPLLPVVPRRPERAPKRERGRTGDAAAGEGHRHRA